MSKTDKYPHTLLKISILNQNEEGTKTETTISRRLEDDDTALLLSSTLVDAMKRNPIFCGVNTGAILDFIFDEDTDPELTKLFVEEVKNRLVKKLQATEKPTAVWNVTIDPRKPKN